mmetsp:Transcript_9569/g.22020  ORF Transcript_9569/g.22020 Transcript_9569/m.22020 type:complete len:303 (+) Transcript_9569:218-1126(+)
MSIIFTLLGLGTGRRSWAHLPLPTTHFTRLTGQGKLTRRSMPALLRIANFDNSGGQLLRIHSHCDARNVWLLMLHCYHILVSVLEVAFEHIVPVVRVQIHVRDLADPELRLALQRDPTPDLHGLPLRPSFPNFPIPVPIGTQRQRVWPSNQSVVVALVANRLHSPPERGVPQVVRERRRPEVGRHFEQGVDADGGPPVAVGESVGCGAVDPAHKLLEPTVKRVEQQRNRSIESESAADSVPGPEGEGRPPSACGAPEEPAVVGVEGSSSSIPARLAASEGEAVRAEADCEHPLASQQGCRGL